MVEIENSMQLVHNVLARLELLKKIEKKKERMKKYNKEYRNRPESKKRKNELSRKNYKRNPERAAKYQRKYYIQIKKEVLTYYGNGKLACVCCHIKNIEFLTLDHIVPLKRNSKIKPGGGCQLYRKLRKENFPSGFQTLCFNCNSAKNKYDKCPHKWSSKRRMDWFLDTKEKG